MLPVMTTVNISVLFYIVNDLEECTTAYVCNRDGNCAQWCIKRKRDVVLRKFPPVGLWYVCKFVTLPCARSLFLERLVTCRIWSVPVPDELCLLPWKKNGECIVQRKSFYHLIPIIYVAKGIKNIFRKLMLDSSSSAFEDIFSYPNVLMYCCLLSFGMFMWNMLIMGGFVRYVRHIY